MDLNELLYRQQVALIRADCAITPENRVMFRARAKCYMGLIRDLQQELGVPPRYLAPGV